MLVIPARAILGVMRILLIEDDKMIGKGLTLALQDAGMSVDWAMTAGDGETAWRNGGYGIVLLDLGLPEKDGLDVLKALRSSGDKTTLMIISARDETADRIAGLDLGADDYLTKPFEIGELLARIRALSRRQGGSAVSQIGTGAILLDLASHELTYHGTRQRLPTREFALMQALLERPGAILSRSQLEERLYGWGEEVESNAVEVLIHYIRRKFDKDIIRNVRGAGWMVEKGTV